MPSLTTLPSRIRRLAREIGRLEFAPPVTHTYNPLEYAWSAHRVYLERFATTKKRAVFLGMNPGPFGMAQSGIPFGAIEIVREWMGIETRIGKPENEHPRRPVLGFATEREEVSGARLWGFARDRFGTPERFFERFFVANYCPLCFLEESGRNRTPDKLPAEEREPLYALCDRLARMTIEALEPEIVIGVGAFAETRAREALDGMGLSFGRVLHPSPASPIANRGWAPQAEAQLEALGIDLGPRPRARKAKAKKTKAKKAGR